MPGSIRLIAMRQLGANCGWWPPTLNQSYTVTPTDSVTLTASADATKNDGSRSFTASGLDDSKTYSVAIFDAANVKVGTDGQVKFTSANNYGDSNGVSIETVNGTPNVLAGTGAGDAQVNNVAPINGQIRFSIDSVEVGADVVPVVFQDANSNGSLDFATAPTTAAPQAPSEAFGIGGETMWNPAAADTGTLGADELISSVDKTAQTITTANAVYSYDSNDTYYVDDDASNLTAVGPKQQVTMADFEKQLSAGDSLEKGTIYQANSALGSTFILADTAPGQPTLAATDGQGKVDLAITPTNPGLTGFGADDTVTVERASVTAGTDATFGTADDVVGAYSDVATLKASDDADTTTANVLDYSDAVKAGHYSYKVFATVDGEDSPESAAQAAESTADSTLPTVSSVGPNDINNGVGSTDQLILTFSEPVSSVDASQFTVYPTAQPGLTIGVTKAAAKTADDTTWVLTLDQSLTDAPTDISYTVAYKDKAFQDAAGNQSVAGSKTFSY